jgi:8-oxo-dGTP pyrophosphatase MutT (NUDIX family)
MGRHFTDEEQLAWINKTANKVVSAKVILYSPAGQVLILQPGYKPGWHFPGGIVDTLESPLQAAVREVREEVGLEITPDMLQFAGVRYGVTKSKNKDYLHIVFTGQLSAAQAAQVRIVDSENEDLKWADPHDKSADIQDKVIELLRTKSDKKYTALYADREDIIVPA